MDAIEEIRKVRLINILLILSLGFFLFVTFYFIGEFSFFGSGESINLLKDALCITNGFVLGPFYGSIATLIGCILYFINEGFIDFGVLIMSIGGTLFTGLLYRNHWKIATLLFGIPILSFFLKSVLLLPTDAQNYYFVIYLIVLFVIFGTVFLIFGDKIHDMLYDSRMIYLSLFFISLCSSLFVYLLDIILYFNRYTLLLSNIPFMPLYSLFDKLIIALAGSILTLFLILFIQSLYQKEELEEKEILDYAIKARNIVEKRSNDKNNKKG